MTGLYRIERKKTKICRRCWQIYIDNTEDYDMVIISAVIIRNMQIIRWERHISGIKYTIGL